MIDTRLSQNHWFVSMESQCFVTLANPIRAIVRVGQLALQNRPISWATKPGGMFHA